MELFSAKGCLFSGFASFCTPLSYKVRRMLVNNESKRMLLSAILHNNKVLEAEQPTSVLSLNGLGLVVFLSFPACSGCTLFCILGTCI